MTRAVVTAKALRTVVKQSCRAFNLPTANFSGESMRKGFVAHAVSYGADPAAYKARGGWSLKSRTEKTHYVSSYLTGT